MVEDTPGGSFFASGKDIALFTPSTGTDSLQVLKDQERVNVLLQQAAGRISGVNTQIHSDAEARRWQVASTKAYNFSVFAGEIMNTLVQKAHEGSATVNQLVGHFDLAVGAMMAIDDSLTDERRIAINCGLATEFGEYEDLYRMSTAPFLTVRFNGTSLKDLRVWDQKTDPTRYFKFLVGEVLFHYEDHPESVYEEALLENPDWNRFPAYFRTVFNYTSTATSSLINEGLSVQRQDGNKGQLEEMYNVSARNTLRIVDQVRAVKTAALHILTDPYSKDFAELKIYILHNSGTRWGDFAPVFIASGSDLKLIELYRKSKAFVVQGVEVEFYSYLEQKIRTIVEDLSVSRTTIQTTERLTSILKTEDSADIHEPSTFKDVKAALNQLGSVSRPQDTQLDPDLIDLGNLIKPQRVEIKFEPGKLSQFVVSLEYDNTYGEALEFNVGFDCRKDKLEWSVLEDPSDPDVKNLYSSIMYLTKNILIQLLQQAEEDRIKRQQTKIHPSVLLRVETKQIKERPEPLPKWKPERTRRLSLLERAMAQLDTKSDAEIKTEILIPEDPVELARVTRSLEPQERIDALAKLQDQNERGVGRIPQYNVKSPDGRNQYKYRMGDLRAILVEEESEKGVRRLSIRDIRNRKNVYRENNM